MKKKREILLVITIFFVQTIFGGFSPETLVRAYHGYVPIGCLEVGDVVTSLSKDDHFVDKKITRKKNCEKKSCLCLLVGNDEIVTSETQKFFLADKSIWIAAKDLKEGDFLLQSNGHCSEILQIAEIDQANLIEITVEEPHNFFVSEGEYLVHNFVSATAGASVGCVVVYNAVTAIFGATIALKTLNPPRYNSYQKERLNFCSHPSGVPSKVTENNAALIERYYYLQRKRELESLKKEFSSILQGIRIIFSKEMLFSHAFFNQIVAQNIKANLKRSSLISATRELQFNKVQKEKLRVARQSELQELERKILEKQWVLAVHFNQLFEQFVQSLDIYTEVISKQNDIAELWNNSRHEIPLDIIHYCYEELFTEAFFLEIVFSRSGELQKAIQYYQSCSKAKDYLAKSFNFFELIKELNEDVVEANSWAKTELERANNNMYVVEDYCARNCINLTGLKQQVFKKVEQQKQKQVQENLNQAKQELSSAPEPEEPEEEEDEEESQKIIFSEKRAKHIFRNKKNHFSQDTPENRKRLLDLVSNKDYRLGMCRRGKEWYGRIVENGKQLWAEVFGGEIGNGGLNEIPNEFNSETGLSRRFPPGKNGK